MKKILPSGAELVVQGAPFADAKALYQATMLELKELKLDGSTNLDYNFVKDIICSGLSSKRFEIAIQSCMKKSTYNGLPINDDVFENENNRQDYIPMLFEVVKENITPFMKGLYAQFPALLEILGKLQA